MELFTIPPKFALLFFIPVIGFGLSLRKGNSCSLSYYTDRAMYSWEIHLWMTIK